MADVQPPKEHKKAIRVIRNVYLYLVSMIGLVTVIFGAVGVINNVLQNYVFQVNDFAYNEPVTVMGGSYCSQAYPSPQDTTGKIMIAPTTQEIADCEKRTQDQQEQSRKNNMGREFSISIAQMGVGLPIWLFHWGIIQKENRRRDEEATA